MLYYSLEVLEALFEPLLPLRRQQFHLLVLLLQSVHLLLYFLRVFWVPLLSTYKNFEPTWYGLAEVFTIILWYIVTKKNSRLKN